jgi:Zn-dependent protease with chaperone function
MLRLLDVGANFSVVLAVAVVLLPGLSAWWMGRRLVRLRDDPALPERLFAYNSRLSQVTIFAIVLPYFLTPRYAPWIMLLAVVARLIGGFPARKAVFGEEWGLVSYLAYVIRFSVARMGFWVLLALGPAVVHMLPWAHWGVPVLLTILLWVWNDRSTWVFLTLVGATPLQRPDLESRFAGVLERAKVGAVQLYRAGPRGGRWVNAFALPSRRGSAVLFTDTLLGLFDADELAAIFAHEVAHLEYYNPHRLRRMHVVMLFVIALGGLAVPLSPRWLASLGGTIHWLWAISIMTALFLRGAHHRAHEAESDRRAVSLCGDPEGLVRALVRLHGLGRLPRRWSVEAERLSSHPSLAQRIQAIRATAGRESAALEAPLAVGSDPPGTFVILEADRAYWLEGVPAGTAVNPAALREHAATFRCVRYSELMDLRVRTKRQGSVALVATARSGRSWSIPLRSGDVAQVQAVLDVVDVRLAKRSGGLIHHPALATILCCLVGIAALVSVGPGTVLVPTAVGIFVPSPTALAAVGATAIGQAALALREVEAVTAVRPYVSGLAGVEIRLAALLLMAVLGGVALLLAGLRARSAPESRPGGIVVLAGSLAAVAVLAWAIMLWAVSLGGRSLHEAARAMPGASLALIGLGAALVMTPWRGMRLAGKGAAVAAIVPLVLGSSWFSDGLPRDSFDAPAELLRWTEGSAKILRQVHVDAMAVALHLSPSGLRFAVREDPEDEEESGHSMFRVGDFSGGLLTIDAEDLAFLDDTRILALARSGSGLELRLVEVDRPHEVRWRKALQDLEGPRLSVDPSRGAWRVMGWDPQSGQLAGMFGVVGEEEIVTDHWAFPGGEPENGEFAYVSPAKAAFAWTVNGAGHLSPWMSLVPGSTVQWELWRLGGKEARRVGVSALPIGCLQSAWRDETLICFSRQKARTEFRLIHGVTAKIRAAGSVPGWVRSAGVASGGRFAAWTGGGVLLVDLPGRTARHLSLPLGYGASVSLAQAPGMLGVLSHRPKGATITVYDIR